MLVTDALKTYLYAILNSGGAIWQIIYLSADLLIGINCTDLQLLIVMRDSWNLFDQLRKYSLNIELIYILGSTAQLSLYLIWAYFLKVMASWLSGGYFVHIFTHIYRVCDVFVELVFIRGDIWASTFHNEAVE